MIDNYNEIMAEWANPKVGTCTNMMEITPDMDLRRWAVRQTVMVLANADYYYTRAEVDKLLEEITTSAVTREEVQAMIDRSIASKADQAKVDAIAEQVRQNTLQILNRYTKEETNSLLSSYLTKLDAVNMRNNYAKVENDTLVLNSEFITI